MPGINEGHDNGGENSHHVAQKSLNVIKQIGNDEIEKMFLPFKHVESGGEDFIDFLKDIVRHIFTLIKKERLDNDYIDAHLGKLSARQLLSAGQAFYMNSCLDFVLVTVEGLKRAGIENSKFIVDELQCPGNWVKVHFGVEILHDGHPYSIDFRSQNDVYVSKENFVSDYKDKGARVVNKIEIDMDAVSTDDTIYSLIEKGLIPFKFFNPKSLDMLKEKLKKDNTPEEYQTGFVDRVKSVDQPEFL